MEKNNRIRPPSRKIAAQIESLYRRYDRRFLSGDPVWFVHQYANPLDQEVVGLISALLAFGNAKAIRTSVGKILGSLGPRPRDFVLSFDPVACRERFRGLGHRWVKGEDLHLLMVVLQRLLSQHSSLKNFFIENVGGDDPDIEKALDRFSQKIHSLLKGETLPLGFRHFFPAPRDGSACKRLNMFLRWMVRPSDGIDLGLWHEIAPRKLIVPLDAHLFRFSQRYHVSRYRTPSWRVARDLTDFLKTLDPADPVKYDFALCHYGMEVGW